MLDGLRSPLVVLGQDDTYSEQAALDQALALADDEQLITALWHLSHQRLLRRALQRGLSLEVAEDIIQDVFSLLADELERVRGPRVLGWLTKMVDYECIRQVSERKRARANLQAVTAHHSQAQALHSLGQPEQQLDRERELAAALELLLTLEPLDAYIMRATIVDGAEAADSIPRITERFGVQLSPKALYERRRRIRVDLAHRLALQRTGTPGGTHD